MAESGRKTPPPKLYYNPAYRDPVGAEMLLDHVTYRATGKHSATIIFLHGLEETGDGWAHLFLEIQKKHVKVCCPTARLNEVSVAGNKVMPSWFDIYGLDKEGEIHNENEIREATERLFELLDHEQRSTGIPSNRIILGGISQGACLAVYGALTYRKPLGGILALSCWFPTKMLTKDVLSEANKDTPFLQFHGDKDEVVPLKYGQESSEFIKTLPRTDKSTYEFRILEDVEHHSCNDEFEYIAKWLDKLIPPLEDPKAPPLDKDKPPEAAAK